MDSVDEEYLRRFDQAVQSKELYIFRWGSYASIRLYEDEEQRIFRSSQCHTLKELQCFDQFTVHLRFRRFFDTIKGFHTGSLDLSGRHKHRYRDLHSRLLKLFKDVTEISLRSEEVNLVIENPDGQPALSDTGESLTDPGYAITPPKLGERFERDWRAKGVDFEYVCEALGKTIGFIFKNSAPVIQKLTLQHLPPELHYRTMWIGGSDVARRLGSACRLFHDIFRGFIYRTRKIDIRLKADRALYGDSVTPEADAYLKPQAQDARDRYLEEVDFLLDSPSITKEFRDLKIFSCEMVNTLEFLGLEIGTKEHVAFFDPLHFKAHQLLQKTVGLRKLSLDYLPITQEVAQAITSYNHLQELHIHFCDLIGVAPLPKCASVLNVVLSTKEQDLGGLWRLLQSFSNIQYLNIVSLWDAPNILPSHGIRAKLNLFLSLKRLKLDSFGPEDISSLISWFRDSDGLKLTHFKLTASKLGISQEQVTQLVQSLRGDTLQFFVLDGIQYAKPQLLGLISDELPNLVALTLLYRNSRQIFTEATVWPCPSWMYASYLGRFNKLEFFGWNLKVECVTNLLSATLLLFENGFSSDSQDREMEWDDDISSVVRALAAYVPTLRVVVFLKGARTPFKISREENGQVQVQKSGMFQGLHFMSGLANPTGNGPWSFSTEIASIPQWPSLEEVTRPLAFWGI